MLIPAKKFIAVRNNDYDLLKESSIKNHTFSFNGVEYVIDNLLVQNVIWNGDADPHGTAPGRHGGCACAEMDCHETQGASRQVSLSISADFIRYQHMRVYDQRR